jgi:predicted DNA-binding transcriptional regulator YafY
LVYYRDNWYLDAWCHRKHALRIFAVARIDCILGTEGVTESIPSHERDAHFSAGYGIFAGQAKQSTSLRFRGEAAREVAMQQWHPGQRGLWDGEDYVLSFPYSDERELVRDILRFVPDVVVETPAALRHAVLQRLEEGLARFGNN